MRLRYKAPMRGGGYDADYQQALGQVMAYLERREQARAAAAALIGLEPEFAELLQDGDLAMQVQVERVRQRASALAGALSAAAGAEPRDLPMLQARLADLGAAMGWATC